MLCGMCRCCSAAPLAEFAQVRLRRRRGAAPGQRIIFDLPSTTCTSPLMAAAPSPPPPEPARALAQLPAMCAEVSMLLRPDVGATEAHLSEVEAVADGMLARLDELAATLGTVSGDAAAQQAALQPAFSSITAGLARDFAYVDGVGDALVNVRLAVQKMEAELALAEAAVFKQQRAKALQNLF